MESSASVPQTVSMLLAVLQQLPRVAIVWKGLDGRVLGCNDNFVHDMGKEQVNEIIGRTDIELGISADEADMQAMIEATVRETGTAADDFFNNSRTTPDGEMCWQKISIVPLKDESQVVIGTLSVYEDVSSQMAIETQRDELIATKEGLLTQLQEALKLKDQITANISHELRTPLHVLFNLYDMLKLLPPYALESPEGIEVLKTLRELPIGKSVAEQKQELLSRVEDLPRRSLSSTDKRKVIKILQALPTDEPLTAEHKQALLQRMADLPISSLGGGKGKSILIKMRANAERLMELINQILDVNKIQSGRLELRPEPTDLRELVQTFAVEIQLLAEAKHLDFSYTIDESVPQMLILDREAFKKVVLPLLHNAVKFTATGFVSLIIGTSGGSLVIVVADSGNGIASVYHHKVFEKFFQVSSGADRKYGGSGLGLSIVSSMTALMDGTVKVESEGVAGKGTTFIVSLPMNS